MRNSDARPHGFSIDLAREVCWSYYVTRQSSESWDSSYCRARKGQDHDKWRGTDFGKERDTRDEKEHKGRRRRSIRGSLFDLGTGYIPQRFVSFILFLVCFLYSRVTASRFYHNFQGREKKANIRSTFLPCAYLLFWHTCVCKLRRIFSFFK